MHANNTPSFEFQCVYTLNPRPYDLLGFPGHVASQVRPCQRLGVHVLRAEAPLPKKARSHSKGLGFQGFGV